MAFVVPNTNMYFYFHKTPVRNRPGCYNYTCNIVKMVPTPDGTSLTKDLIRQGHSHLHPNDAPNPDIARRLALHRAVRDFPRSERLIIMRAYTSRKRGPSA